MHNIMPTYVRTSPLLHKIMSTRAVRYHLKFAYHDTIVRVSRYTLGIDTSHDMAYMR